MKPPKEYLHITYNYVYSSHLCYILVHFTYLLKEQARTEKRSKNRNSSLQNRMNATKNSLKVNMTDWQEATRPAMSSPVCI